MDTAPRVPAKGDATESVDRTLDGEKFLQFQYPELKDLGKHFLTVVSASLAFTATFAEKILDISHATPTQKWLLISALAMLIVSIVAVGTGIYFNYRAGSRAKGSIIVRGKYTFRVFVGGTYFLYTVGGMTFILALVLLGVMAILRIR